MEGGSTWVGRGVEIQEYSGNFGGHMKGEEFLQEVYFDKLYLLMFRGGWRLSIWQQPKAFFRSSRGNAIPFSAALGLARAGGHRAYGGCSGRTLGHRLETLHLYLVSFPSVSPFFLFSSLLCFSPSSQSLSFLRERGWPH